MSTIEDYQRLETAHPISGGLDLAQAADDDPQRWRIILHGMILRKYFAPRDHLNLTEVIRSLRALAPDTLPDAAWDELQQEVLILESSGEFSFNDQKPRTEMTILEHELYGRYLHGDYGKWALRAHDSMNDLALYLAVVNQATRVAGVAGLVRQFESRGQLAL